MPGVCLSLPVGMCMFLLPKRVPSSFGRCFPVSSLSSLTSSLTAHSFLRLFPFTALPWLPVYNCHPSPGLRSVQTMAQWASSHSPDTSVLHPVRVLGA